MAKSVVSIVKGTDAEKMVSEALDLLGGVSSLIKPGSTVVVKPNTIGQLPPERGTSTSPAVVGAVIKELRKAQPKEIILAEGCKGETPQCFEISGQRKAAEEAGVDRLINIRTEKDLIKIPIRDHRSYLEFVMLPRFLVEADHIVNLPLFKTHVSMDFTCALKNMKGIVQGPVQAEMHIMGRLDESMMDLWSVCKADLQIVDMIHPTEGYGPLSGAPTQFEFSCIVAGKDPLAVDATCCRMVGLPLNKVPYLEKAHERGLGNYKEKDIEIRGRKIKEVFKQLWMPYLDDIVQEYPEYKIYVNEGSCSMCEGLVAYSLERLKALGEYDKNAGMTIVLGNAKEIPKNVKPLDLIIMGDCARKFRDQGIFVEGCPPGENMPAAAIMDRRYDGFGPGKRDYYGEIAIFLDYLKKKRAQKK